MSQRQDRVERQWFINSGTSLVYVGIATIVAVAVPPFVLRWMRLDEYGVWALLGTVTPIIGLLDLGLGSSVVVLSARGLASGAKAGVGEHVGTAMFACCAASAACMSIALAAGSEIAHALFPTGSLALEYQKALVTYIGACCCSVMATPLAGLVRGYQRYDLANYVEVASLVTNVAVLAALLGLAGAGMEALVAGAGSGAATRLAGFGLIAVFFSRRDGIRWTVAPRREVVASLFRFSLPEQSVRLYHVLTQTVIRVSISGHVGLGALGAYDIAKRIISQISGFSAVIFAPLTPAAAGLGGGDKARIRRMVDTAVRLVLLVAVPAALYVIAFGEPLIADWIGQASGQPIAVAAKVLAVGAVLSLVTGPLTTVALGLGNIRLHLASVLTMGGACVLLVPVGSKTLGLPGAVLGEAGSIAFGTMVTVGLFVRWHGALSTMAMLRSATAVTLSAAAGLAVAAGTEWLIQAVVDERVTAVWRWSLNFCVYGLATAAGFWCFGVVTAEEIRGALRIVKGRGPGEESV
jgi:O-antigen/teichoic acid export membrane protein